MSEQAWDQDEIEMMLLQVLVQQTKNQYQRALAKVAEQLKKGEPNSQGRRDGDPVNRTLWGLSIRAIEYVGPSPIRSDRTGAEWTWPELKVLKWAFTKDRPAQSKGKPAPDVDYISRLLRRSVEDINLKRGITREETKGFGLS